MEALAESNFVVEEYGEDRHLMHVDDLKVSGFFSVPSLVKDEWGAILRVNYWPIFWTANQVLNKMSVSQNAKVLNVLWRTVQELVAGGVTRSHDLTGIVFQRLIADRKFLATFYTKTGRRVIARRSCDAGGPAPGRSGLGRRRNTRRRSDRRLRMRHRHTAFRGLPTHVAATRAARRRSQVAARAADETRHCRARRAEHGCSPDSRDAGGEVTPTPPSKGSAFSQCPTANSRTAVSP